MAPGDLLFEKSLSLAEESFRLSNPHRSRTSEVRETLDCEGSWLENKDER
jgi:hypothetical protein